jgi:hypothetical protein
MTLETKHCNGCGEDKELSEFNFRKSGRYAGKPRGRCKECENKVNSVWHDANLEKVYATNYARYHANPKKANAASRAWKQANPERVTELQRVWRKTNVEKTREYAREAHYRNGVKPAAENKSSSLYLGCVIAETILSREFPGFKRMPNGNTGYDYDCPKGYKIDVKSGCRLAFKNRNDSWQFHINKNKIADFFLCIAFDDRENLNPEHIWLIPGGVVNDKQTIVITDSPEILAKWSQYERPLENVMNCCDKLRGENSND